MRMSDWSSGVCSSDLVAPCRPGCRVARGTRLTECRLDIFEAELQLLRVELLGTRAKPMPHEGVDDRLQALNLAVGLALGERHQIGRASCRERVCQYLSIWAVAVSYKKKNSKL